MIYDIVLDRKWFHSATECPANMHAVCKDANWRNSK